MTQPATESSSDELIAALEYDAEELNSVMFGTGDNLNRAATLIKELADDLQKHREALLQCQQHLQREFDNFQKAERWEEDAWRKGRDLYLVVCATLQAST